MSSIAMPSRWRRSASSAMISVWVVTSSAVVGSSATSRRGRQPSATASSARWRMPPDSSWAYEVATLSGRRTRPSSSRTRAPTSTPRSWRRTLSAIWRPTFMTGFR